MVRMALVAAVVAYLATWAPAEVYADLVRAAYDVYRARLYQALQRQMPADPAAEWAAGDNLTEFLFRCPPRSPA